MATSIAAIHKKAAAGERISMVTCYDYTGAQFAQRAEIDLLLVGDSLGMVMQGHTSTIPVTLDDIIYHCRAVIRGCQTPLVVADLPFGTYGVVDDAVRNAARLMREGGPTSVKLEGGRPMAPIVKRLVEMGIPVMGHLGYTPQSVHQIGTRIQAKQASAARALIEDALALQEAGAWAIVLELIPAPLAAEVTARLDIPTIGIGAGVECDGEVQVWHDVLGLYPDFLPKHARQFAQLGDQVVAALSAYRDAVTDRTFPGPANSAGMDAAELAAALEGLR